MGDPEDCSGIADPRGDNTHTLGSLELVKATTDTFVVLPRSAMEQCIRILNGGGAGWGLRQGLSAMKRNPSPTAPGRG